jgi:hypothetical protein
MFTIWHLRRQRNKQNNIFLKKFKALPKGAPMEQQMELSEEHRDTLLGFDQFIDFTITEKISDEAIALDVPLPPKTDTEMWSHSEDGTMEFLTPTGRAFTRKIIDAEKTRRRDVNAWWWKNILAPAVTALTGLIGAIIGLVAILKKH